MVTKRFRYCVFLVSKLYIFSRHSKTNKNVLHYSIILYHIDNSRKNLLSYCLLLSEY